jgi:hypothetical protein
MEAIKTDGDRLAAYESGKLTEDEMIKLFQEMINDGSVWRLQGSYIRTAFDLVDSGRCMLGEVGHDDYFGDYVPSRYEVRPGSPGSAEFVALQKE